MKCWISITTTLVFICCISCQNKSALPSADQLNGYWEIVSVELEDGNRKDFSINTTVDYIKVTENKGVRKKLQPKLDGSFITSKNAETFQLKVENDSLRLYYETPYATWIETIIAAKDSTLVVKNNDGKVFRYKKFTKFDFK